MTICHLRHSLRQNFSLLYLSPFQELLPQQIFLDLTLRTFFSINWSSWDPGFDIDIEKFTLRKVRQCIVTFANPPLAYEVGLGTNLVLKSWKIWKRLFGGGYIWQLTMALRSLPWERSGSATFIERRFIEPPQTSDKSSRRRSLLLTFYLEFVFL